MLTVGSVSTELSDFHHSVSESECALTVIESIPPLAFILGAIAEISDPVTFWTTFFKIANIHAILFPH